MMLLTLVCRIKQENRHKSKKKQDLNTTFESESSSNDTSSDLVHGGHTIENIAVVEYVQHARRTIAVNDEKYENGYDADGSIGPFYDVVEHESSLDESLVGSSPMLFE